MKKLIALLLALLCIVITVSACTGDGTKEEETTTASQEEITTVKPETPTEEPESETFEDQEGQKYGEIHGVQG